MHSSYKRTRSNVQGAGSLVGTKGGVLGAAEPPASPTPSQNGGALASDPAHCLNLANHALHNKPTVEVLCHTLGRGINAYVLPTDYGRNAQSWAALLCCACYPLFYHWI